MMDERYFRKQARDLIDAEKERDKIPVNYYIFPDGTKVPMDRSVIYTATTCSTNWTPSTFDASMVGSQRYKCQYCGRKNKDDSECCNGCGAPL